MLQISFDEALHLIRMRHPNIEGGKSVRLSFDEKYVLKDGGSAGLAFSLLFFSLIDGLSLDERVAVTGDVTVDWRVREVGGIRAKVDGATRAGKAYVIIPSENVSTLEDILLLEGPECLLKIQILAASTVSEAAEFARTDRTTEMQAMLDEFTQLQQYALKHGLAQASKSTVFQKKLRRISKSLPQHASATYLAKLSAGWHPRRLSQSASLTELLSALYPHQRQVLTGRSSPSSLQTETQVVIDTLLTTTRLQGLVHPQLTPLAASAADYARKLGKLKKVSGKDSEAFLAPLKQHKIDLTGERSGRLAPMSSKPSTQVDYRKVQAAATELAAASRRVRDELGKLSINRDFIAAMME